MNDNEQKKIFSRNLSNILRETGKSQKEVADAIGVSPQTFNTWMQGIALPRMGKVQLLADYFDLKKSDLIEENNEASININLCSDDEQEFNQLFSKNLLNQLQTHDMSQAELAKLMNVSATSVSNWCQGTKIPRMDKIDQLCNIFQCMRSDLIMPPATDENKELIKKSVLNDDEKLLLTNFNKLNPSGKQKANDFVQDLTEIPRYSIENENNEKITNIDEFRHKTAKNHTKPHKTDIDMGGGLLELKPFA